MMKSENLTLIPIVIQCPDMNHEYMLYSSIQDYTLPHNYIQLTVNIMHSKLISCINYNTPQP